MKDLLKNKDNLVYFSKNIINELFSLSLILYLLLFILEEFKNGVISFYLNINYVLIFVVISGMMVVLFKADKNNNI